MMMSLTMKTVPIAPAWAETQGSSKSKIKGKVYEKKIVSCVSCMMSGLQITCTFTDSIGGGVQSIIYVA